jgi:hypothetical protein
MKLQGKVAVIKGGMPASAAKNSFSPFSKPDRFPKPVRFERQSGLKDNLYKHHNP